MQVSKQKINKTLQKEIYSVFHQLIADLKNVDEVEEVLRDLLSEVEHQVIAKRIAIALFLEKGRSYDHIKENLKVSSATIASVQESMSEPGMQLALKKVKAEQWADEWAEKITSLVGKIMPTTEKAS